MAMHLVVLPGRGTRKPRVHALACTLTQAASNAWHASMPFLRSARCCCVSASARIVNGVGCAGSLLRVPPPAALPLPPLRPRLAIPCRGAGRTHSQSDWIIINGYGTYN